MVGCIMEVDGSVSKEIVPTLMMEILMVTFKFPVFTFDPRRLVPYTHMVKVTLLGNHLGSAKTIKVLLVVYCLLVKLYSRRITSSDILRQRNQNNICSISRMLSGC